MFKIQIYLHILRIVVYSYDEKEKRLLSDSSGFSFFPSRMHWLRVYLQGKNKTLIIQTRKKIKKLDNWSM